MSSQYEDNVQRMLHLMKDTFADTFATYYDGDPEAIPTFNLPALIVTQTSDETQEGAIGQDDVSDSLTIKVVFNKRDDWDGDKVNPLNMTERKIRDLVSKRDPLTGNYDPKTVKGAIRAHALDGIIAVANNMNVQYGINPRTAGEHLADLTAEGHVSFTIQYCVNVY